MNEAILPLQSLLLDGETSNGSSQEGQQRSRDDQVGKHRSWSLSSNHSGELVGVDHDVQYGLAEVGVEIDDAFAHLLQVLSQELIWIRDAIVEVVDLVVSQSVQILLEQVVAQARSEAKRHLFQRVAKKVVYASDREGSQQEFHQSLGELGGVSANDDSLDVGCVLDHPQVAVRSRDHHRSSQNCVKSFHAEDSRIHNLEDIPQAFEKNSIDCNSVLLASSRFGYVRRGVGRLRLLLARILPLRNDDRSSRSSCRDHDDLDSVAGISTLILSYLPSSSLPIRYI